MVSFVAPLFLAASAVASQSVQFYAESTSNETMNGMGLYSIHEGAGFNYFFIGHSDASSSTFSYNSDNSTVTLYTPATPGYIIYELGVSDNFLEIGVIGDIPAVTIDSNDYLNLNGSKEGFYACLNTGDPYSVSKHDYEVMYYSDDSAPEHCIDIYIKASFDGATDVESSAASSTNAAIAAVTSASSQTHTKNSKTHTKESQTHTKKSQTHTKESQTHTKESKTHTKQSQAHTKESQTHTKQPQTHTKESQTHTKESQTHTKESQTHTQTHTKESQTHTKESKTQTHAQTKDAKVASSTTVATTSASSISSYDNGAAASFNGLSAVCGAVIGVAALLI